jgi:hypothetical protein
MLVMSGCSDFLAEQSQDERIPSSANDLSEILLGRGYPWGNDNLIPYVYLLGDEIISFHETAIGVGNLSAYQLLRSVYTWQPDMFETEPIQGWLNNGSSYATFYMRIGGANTVLDMIDNATGSQERKDRTKAEAYAIRAMHYFYLVNLFGKPYNVDKKSLGVPLKLSIGIDINPMVRNTVEEVYQQILSDLNAAIALFEKYEVTRGDNRINLPATYILLSRVHLYMENWDGVIDAATKAINLSRGLHDMRGFTTWTAINTYAFTETEWLWGRADYHTILSSVHFVVSPSLLSLYDQVNDARFSAFFRPLQSGLINNIRYTGTVVNKNTHNVSASLGNSMRIAEAYINRAEAYARKNDPRAVNDINAIRSNRIRGYVPVASVTLEDVLIERQKELCFEVPRWFDLRRLGMPSITRTWANSTTSETYVLRENDPMYTLPIPPLVITHNPAMVQNPSRFMDNRLPE